VGTGSLTFCFIVPVLSRVLTTMLSLDCSFFRYIVYSSYMPVMGDTMTFHTSSNHIESHRKAERSPSVGWPLDPRSSEFFNAGDIIEDYSAAFKSLYLFLICSTERLQARRDDILELGGGTYD
jgi:hypothetical protein